MLGVPFMPRWAESALVQLMVCCLYGAKPSPLPMLHWYQMDPREQASMKFDQKNNSVVSNLNS